jgi:hypothetical protein
MPTEESKAAAAKSDTGNGKQGSDGREKARAKSLCVFSKLRLEETKRERTEE